MDQAIKPSGIVAGVHSVLSLKRPNRLAVSDLPCPQHTAQAFPVEPVTANRFVIGVGQAGRAGATPHQYDAPLVVVVVSRVDCQHNATQVVRREDRSRSVRIPDDAEIQDLYLLNHEITVPGGP